MMAETHLKDSNTYFRASLRARMCRHDALQNRASIAQRPLDDARPRRHDLAQIALAEIGRYHIQNCGEQWGFLLILRGRGALRELSVKQCEPRCEKRGVSIGLPDDA